MKVTFPHMGNIHLPLKHMLEDIGLEVVVPPPNSKKTLTLGTKHSPEFVCLPFKMTLGNFIEGIEAGADTLLMAGGPGRCRFGFYGELQQRILRDLGYNIVMHTVDTSNGALMSLIRILQAMVPELSWLRGFQAIRRGITVLQAVDTLEKELYKIRPREVKRGESTKVFCDVISRLEHARTIPQVKAVCEHGLRLFREIPQDCTRNILRIGLLGEIYVVLEPYPAADIERRLGEMGVEVSKYLYPSDWALFNMFIKALKIIPEHRSAAEAAKPYLNYHVGGDGLTTVGQTVLCAQDGLDGVIQLYPFTCMPEIVAQYMLTRVQEDFNMPVLELGIDEHTGEAGMQTRVEAFLDLIARRKGVAAR
jgi:predicted nucleotide-binding protein (sugar kinase/HSP70/actin superfamily)